MKRTGLVVGSTLVAIVVIAAVVSCFWTPYDPNLAIPQDRLLGPSAQHWLGTDQVGADLLSRMLVGAQTCLLVGVVSVLIAAGIGVPWGIATAMVPRPWSTLLARAADLLYAFPALLLAIILAAAVGGSTWTGMIAIGVATIPVFARISRVTSRQVLGEDYVVAARSSGTGSWRIAVTHVLPNILPMTVVQVSVALALAILAEAGLSFLGLGTPAPYASWGRMLQSSQAFLSTAPHLALWPGLAIAATVLGFNLLGDAVADRRSHR